LFSLDSNLPEAVHFPSIFPSPLLSILSSAKGGMFLFYGDSALFDLAPPLALWSLRLGEPVLFIDGDNRFNPYPLTDLARKIGLDPEPLLSNLQISRAFTLHHMDALINTLPAQIARYRSKFVILSSPLETYYDEAIPLVEAKNLLRRSVLKLSNLAKKGIFIMVLSPLPPKQAKSRADFLSLFQQQATCSFLIKTGQEFASLEEPLRPDPEQLTLIF
jgi:hypothetical protein